MGTPDFRAATLVSMYVHGQAGLASLLTSQVTITRNGPTDHAGEGISKGVCKWRGQAAALHVVEVAATS